MLSFCGGCPKRSYAPHRSPATLVSTPWAIAALGGRVALLGYERIITKELTTERTPLGAAFLFFAIGTVLWLPALFWTGLPDPRVLLYASGVSLVYAAAFFLYVGALARSDASIVGPLYHTSILVVILLAFLLLDEAVTPLRVAGGVLLLYGASLLRRTGSPLAVVSSFKALFEDPGARMMILGSLLLGAGRIVDKWIVSSFATDVALGELAPTASYAIIQNLFIATWMLLVLAATGRLAATKDLLVERPKTAFVAGAINLTSYLFLLVSFTGLDASIAEPASSVSMVVTVVLAGLFLGEPWRDRLPGALVMVLGAWLLFL